MIVALTYATMLIYLRNSGPIVVAYVARGVHCPTLPQTKDPDSMTLGTRFLLVCGGCLPTVLLNPPVLVGGICKPVK